MGLHIINQKKAPQTRLEKNPTSTYWKKVNNHPNPKITRQFSLLTLLKFPVVQTTQVTALKKPKIMKRKGEYGLRPRKSKA